jgi:hypothetical protein
MAQRLLPADRKKDTIGAVFVERHAMVQQALLQQQARLAVLALAGSAASYMQRRIRTSAVIC